MATQVYPPIATNLTLSYLPVLARGLCAMAFRPLLLFAAAMLVGACTKGDPKPSDHFTDGPPAVQADARSVPPVGDSGSGDAATQPDPDAVKLVALWRAGDAKGLESWARDRSKPFYQRIVALQLIYASKKTPKCGPRLRSAHRRLYVKLYKQYASVDEGFDERLKTPQLDEHHEESHAACAPKDTPCRDAFRQGLFIDLATACGHQWALRAEIEAHRHADGVIAGDFCTALPHYLRDHLKKVLSILSGMSRTDRTWAVEEMVFCTGPDRYDRAKQQEFIDIATRVRLGRRGERRFRQLLVKAMKRSLAASTRF